MPRLYDQTCPIARTLDIVGDRWTLLIVRDLLLGSTRFSEFLAGSPGLPPNVLSDRLKRLVDRGLVERSVYSEHPLRAEYRLTPRGRTLRPVIEAISAWGFENCFEGEPETRAEVQRAVQQAGFAVPAAD
jgi:DNA-binding HxlR family transcriptional regulator